MLNWNLISDKWNQMSSQLKSQWDKLTDDDLKEIDGSQEALTAKLQERYGFLRMDAEKKVADWANEHCTDVEKSAAPKADKADKADKSRASAINATPNNGTEEEPNPDKRLTLDEDRPEEPTNKLTPPQDRRHETADRAVSQSSIDNAIP